MNNGHLINEFSSFQVIFLLRLGAVACSLGLATSIALKAANWLSKQPAPEICTSVASGISLGVLHREKVQLKQDGGGV